MTVSVGPPRSGPTKAARVLSWANLATQTAIIVTGGAVRLTGSGLGCSTWPNCEPGQFTPEIRDATDLHGLIEFGNRTLAGVVLAVALALAVVLLVRARRDQRRRPDELIAVGIVLGVVGQAVLGGMTVWFELHPALVSSHFGISSLLVAASAYLVVRLREGEEPRRALPATGLRPVRGLGVALAFLAGALIAVGVVVTGAGPHSGDAEVGYRFAVDPVTVSRLHAAIAWVFTGVLVTIVVLLARARPKPGTTALLTRARRRAVALLAITVAQGAVGYVQFFNDLPELLVGIHLFGSAVLVAATTFTVTGLRTRDLPDPDLIPGSDQQVRAISGGRTVE